eukprot:TRINITY_DN50672_c0_g1_i1.p1 TRINITY_DN50672_c0_g1~~TRINITY_DN50672_c0_g1_i1.p1  ORF type:complete len:223 (+),score=101.36 TRINITY_DN50672_c0_g1_i1:56-724(+)
MSLANGVVALKYKDGVLIGTDTQLHYGSFTKFPNVNRHFQIGTHTTLATSGYWSDTQFLVEDLYESDKDDFLSADGHKMTDAKSIHSYLKFVMYNKRCDFKPAIVSIVVAGKEKGKEPYLGWVDSVGSFAQADYFATGLAHYLTTPLLVEASGNGRWKNLSFEDAKAVMDKCLTILFLRLKPSCARVMLSKTTEEGQELVGPYEIDQTAPMRGVIQDQQEVY